MKPYLQLHTRLDGSFRIGGLTRGKYFVLLSPQEDVEIEAGLHEIPKPGKYIPVKKQVAVADGGRAEVEIVAVTGGVIGGKVITPADPGRSTFDMEVTARPEAGLVVYRADIYDNGSYAIPGLPGGRYVIHVSCKGFENATYGPVDVEPGKATGGVDVSLVRGLAISGRVVTSDGEGAAGVRVTFTRKGKTVDTRTDSEGNFISGGLIEGKYTVKAASPEFHAPEGKEVAAGAEDVVLKVVRGVKVPGVLTGEKVPYSVWFIAESTSEPKLRVSKSVFIRGRKFTIYLPPGTYSIKVSARRGAVKGIVSGVVVEEGRPVDEITIKMKKAE